MWNTPRHSISLGLFRHCNISSIIIHLNLTRFISRHRTPPYFAAQWICRLSFIYFRSVHGSEKVPLYDRSALKVCFSDSVRKCLPQDTQREHIWYNLEMLLPNHWCFFSSARFYGVSIMQKTLTIYKDARDKPLNAGLIAWEKLEII